VLALLFTGAIPIFANNPSLATGGRVDVAPIELTGGAEIFVYVPNGIDGASRLTNPILLIFGYERFTEDSAREMAESSGLADFARREHSVIAFVNPIGDEWGEEDAEAFSIYAGALFAERPTQAGTPDDRPEWIPELNMFENGEYRGFTGHRYYFIAADRGADFVNTYLMDDTVTTLYGWGGRAAALPANVMLFNPTVPPTVQPNLIDGTLQFEFPAILVNGTSDIANAFSTLNHRSDRVLSLTSSLTSGFDYEIIESQFNQLISVRRSGIGPGNNVIFDVPVWEALGVEVVEHRPNLAGEERLLLAYIPNDLANAPAGTIPLVIGLHGMGEMAEFFALMSTWPEVGAREGFITVTVNDHNEIPIENTPDLVNYILQSYPMIDTTRIFMTGFSMGMGASINRAVEFPELFAGIAPEAGGPAIAEITTDSDLIIPTILTVGEREQFGNAFPGHTHVGGNVQEFTEERENGPYRFLEHLFVINDICDGIYVYDANADNTFWGIADFYNVQIVPAVSGRSVMTVNSIVSNDGNVYTKLVNTSYLAHNIFREHPQVAWDFLSQFSRNPDGSISIASAQAVPVVAGVEQISALNDVQRRYVGGVAFVPFRAVAEASGATVEWDGDTQTVIVVDANGNEWTFEVGYRNSFLDAEIWRVFVTLEHAADMFQ